MRSKPPYSFMILLLNESRLCLALTSGYLLLILAMMPTRMEKKLVCPVYIFD